MKYLTKNKMAIRMEDKNFKQIKTEFERISGLQVECVCMKKGTEHKATKLEDSKSGVYVFFNENVCFKVGKATCNARWQYNHYSASDGAAGGLLSMAILEKKEEVKKYFDKSVRQTIENLSGGPSLRLFIENNISRVEFKIQGKDKFALGLLECLAHFYLKPIFEGSSSGV